MKGKETSIRLSQCVVRRILIILCFMVGWLSLVAEDGISNYKVDFGLGNLGSEKMLMIRSFDQSGLHFYIGVNLDNLETKIVPSNQISVHKISWQQILLNYSNTAYVRAIQAAKTNSYSLQNSGVIHGYPKEKGAVVTIDLCPSHKPLDRIIFTSLVIEFEKIEKPVPIALSVTGRFMLTHKEDMLWIKDLAASGKISVTWVNHSYNHNYTPEVPLKSNFLLEPKTDIDFEILQTEIALLQHGFLASVFFRFPGLISNKSMVDTVTKYGLIPVGSDAWLAKGQPIQNGSIILIHGNGNEPKGVQDFLQLLRTEKSSVMNKEWLLYDLRQSIEKEFKQ